MYRQEEANAVSLTSYKNIFNTEFHFKIKALKKDTCNVCNTLKLKKDNEPDEEKKEQLRHEHNNHLKIAEALKMRRDDFSTVKESEDQESLSFDLEKNIAASKNPYRYNYFGRI